MAGQYEVFVKKGDYGYKDKTGEYGVIDFSKKTDDFAEALQSFLEWTTDLADLEDEESSNKVTLIYRRKAKK